MKKLVAAAFALIFAINAAFAQSSIPDELPGLDIKDLGLDYGELELTDETITALLAELSERGDAPISEAQLAQLRALAGGYSSELDLFTRQVEAQLEDDIPLILVEFGISQEFTTRCRGFVRAMESAEDEATRAEILEESDFCEARIAEARAAIADERDQKQARLDEVIDEIEALEAREDQLTQEELDRLEELRREREEVQERIEDLDEGDRWLAVLQLFVSFFKFAAGLGSVIAGNPAGVGAMIAGAAGMKDAVDTLQGGGERVNVAAEPGPVGEDDVAGVRDVAEQEAVDLGPDDYPETLIGEPIQTSNTGLFIMTAAGLGTDAAQLRFYSKANADDGPVLTLTPADIAADEGANISDFVAIIRYTEAPIAGPEDDRQVVLVFTARVGDAEPTQFSLQLLPLSNGSVLMTERTEE